MQHCENGHDGRLQRWRRELVDHVHNAPRPNLVDARDQPVVFDKKMLFHQPRKSGSQFRGFGTHGSTQFPNRYGR